MRLTQVLCKMTNYRIFKLRWEQQKRKRAPLSKEYLHVSKLGLPTVNATEYLEKAKEGVVPIEFDSDVRPAEPLFETLKFDESHPDYRANTCYCLDDTNVLLEGLEHSKLLLNSVQIQEGLPKEVEDSVGTQSVPFQDTRVKRLIMYANVFDSMQVLLPKRKDPERPAWNFPRDYGIDSKRKFHLTITQMLQLCDFVDGKASLALRSQVPDAYCCANVEKEGHPIQIQNRADILVTSKVPIAPLTQRSAGNSIPLPDLHPLKFNVSIPKQHFYHNRSIFPISKEFLKSHPHTAFFHFDPVEVKNLYEEPVTESQFLSRTVVKAFAVAAARAQQLHGDNVKQLPEPITIQAVHTDNRRFHFAVLQLNTLDLDATAQEKNIVWMLPQAIDLFSECGYVKGRPVLEEYNPEVFQRILSFYCNGL
ncbi:hypothetical protein ONE63_001246 [Megalurothrips usitatus]|uniref:Large ribosomal subunit protein mL37 n=1 Tax=Megalurothrips usitatus TaxID=439358 RepID=A0AAV7XFW4_9NEOP|nr:hypothetical protein ONE63_001246 [Megalurothrips usitatus]